jgi:hypothetical protein
MRKILFSIAGFALTLAFIKRKKKQKKKTHEFDMLPSEW